MSDSVFESRSIPKAYFTLAVPVVLSMVISIVYNLTDTLFVSLTKNTSLIAGISLCTPVFTLLMGFGNIFGQGGSSLISRLLGLGDRENLQRVSSFCFWAAILFGVAAGAVMLLFSGPILRLLGADEETFSYARDYYFCFAACAPLVVLSFIHTNLLRAEGMARESMIGTVGGSVLNMLLDPLFIFAFRMGAAGAAAASVLGYAFTDVYCLYMVKKRSQALNTDPKKAHIEAKYLWQIFAIGISAALSNIMLSFCLTLTNRNLAPFGDECIAAMGIVQKLCMVVMLIITGFAFGGAPLIGYTFGSGDQKRMKELISFVLRFLCITAIVLSLVLVLFAPLLLRAFLQEDVIFESDAVLMLQSQVAGMAFMAIVLFITIYFQATGNALPALILSVSRQGIVFAAVLYAACALWSYKGILWTQAISDVLSALLAIFLYFLLPSTGKENKLQ